MISWVYIFVAHINAWIKRFGKPAMVERFRETGNCPGNNFDPFAVAVIRDGEIISHVLKLISTASPQFQHQAQATSMVEGIDIEELLNNTGVHAAVPSSVLVSEY